MCKKGKAKIIRDSCHALEHVGLLGEELDLSSLWRFPWALCCKHGECFCICKNLYCCIHLLKSLLCHWPGLSSFRSFPELYIQIRIEWIRQPRKVSDVVVLRCVVLQNKKLSVTISLSAKFRSP